MSSKADNPEAVLRILKEEYGIVTEAQLDTAIANLGLIDISLFTTPYFEEEETNEAV